MCGTGRYRPMPHTEVHSDTLEGMSMCGILAGQEGADMGHKRVKGDEGAIECDLRNLPILQLYRLILIGFLKKCRIFVFKETRV